jgi:hypothetical protein
MALERDWLSGGYVPAGGRGGFLPVISPARREVPRANLAQGSASQRRRAANNTPSRSKRSPQITEADEMLPRASAAVGVRTPRFVAKQQSQSARHAAAVAPLSSGRYHQRPAHRGYTPRVEATRLATAQRMARALIVRHGHMGYGDGGPPRRGRRGPRMRARLVTNQHQTHAVPPPPPALSPERHGPVRALHAAKEIGLRSEVEHCAAIVLQTVVRLLPSRIEKALHRAASTIQKYVRHRRHERLRRQRIASLMRRGTKEMRDKALVKRKEMVHEKVQSKFAAWWEQKQHDDPSWQANVLPPPLMSLDERRALIRTQTMPGSTLWKQKERVKAEMAAEADAEQQELDLKRQRKRDIEQRAAEKQHAHRKKARDLSDRQQAIMARWDTIHAARRRCAEKELLTLEQQRLRSGGRLRRQLLRITCTAWRALVEGQARAQRARASTQVGRQAGRHRSDDTVPCRASAGRCHPPTHARTHALGATSRCRVRPAR